MSRVPRVVRNGKKRKVMGEREVLRREDYESLGLDARVTMIRELVSLGLMEVYETLDDEVLRLAGERYERTGNQRHGRNPGSVQLAGQRIPIWVPRVRGPQGEVPLASYGELRRGGDLDEGLFRRVLYGISCRNYEKAAESVPGAIGLSSSTVSRRFVDASAGRLREFQERDLSDLEIVVIFLDGKTFGEDEMVLALGVSMDGRKHILGFVQTATENERVTRSFLRSLLDRGLDISCGVLVVIDGARGLRSAVKKAFRGRVLVSRCQWHKRENVVGYLAKGDQKEWRRRLQRAYERSDYREARERLLEIRSELEELNQSAAASLAEGFEETLTLHRLGIFGVLGRSLKTTNCLESINAMAEQVCGKVDCWKNSSQKLRWFAAALLDIEPRLRKIMGYRHLPKLRDAIMRELKIENEQVVTRQVA
jgi:transposase-like protein